MEVPEDLIHAAFFFVDIVGLSDPTMSTNTQTVKIRMLNKFIKESHVLKTSSKDELIILPTGDGMFIGFIDGLEQPLKLAIELQKKIEDYNKDKSSESFERVDVRIGCHIGNVFLVDDISGTKNVWGPGIIMARRVMDLGDSGHILMTSEMAESVAEVNEEYEKIIYPLHDYEIKHGQTILLYSMFSETIGNPKRPKKGFIGKSKYVNWLANEIKTNVFHHARIELDYTLIDIKTNLIRHTIKYEFVNKSKEPIYKLMNKIVTNTETNFNELNINIYDKNNEKLKIMGINVDTNHEKEFTFKLNDPIFCGESGQYTISYHVREQQKNVVHRLFQELSDLRVSFESQIQDSLNPALYYKKKNYEKIDLEPTVQRKHSVVKFEWNQKEIYSEDLMILEW